MTNVLSCVALCLTLAISAHQTVSKPKAREGLDTAMAEAIRVLESKDYKTFILQFAPPDVVKQRAGTPEGLAQVVTRLGETGPDLLAAFKEAKAGTPVYDTAKTTATFALKGDGRMKSLLMVKIEKYWYFGDK